MSELDVDVFIADIGIRKRPPGTTLSEPRRCLISQSNAESLTPQRAKRLVGLFRLRNHLSAE